MAWVTEIRAAQLPETRACASCAHAATHVSKRMPLMCNRLTPLWAGRAHSCSFWFFAASLKCWFDKHQQLREPAGLGWGLGVFTGENKVGYLSECRNSSLETSLRNWKKDKVDRKEPNESSRNKMADVPSSSTKLNNTENDLYKITSWGLWNGMAPPKQVSWHCFLSTFAFMRRIMLSWPAAVSKFPAHRLFGLSN